MLITDIPGMGLVYEEILQTVQEKLRAGDVRRESPGPVGKLLNKFYVSLYENRLDVQYADGNINVRIVPYEKTFKVFYGYRSKDDMDYDIRVYKTKFYSKLVGTIMYKMLRALKEYYIEQIPLCDLTRFEN